MKLMEVVSTKPREAFIREYCEQPLLPDQIRVKVQYAAAKHGTEFTSFRRQDPFVSRRFDEDAQLFLEDKSAVEQPYFFRPGNMWVGKIIEIGADVKGFKIGQQVAGYGPFRTTQTINADQALVVPDGMHWKEAVCYDPAQFALGGVRDGHIRVGDNVAIFGLGAIGLIAAQLAKIAGARQVIVCDPIEYRRNIAIENGADCAIDPVEEDAGLHIRKLTNYRGADVVIETSGNYHALQAAIRGTARNGTVSLVGWYHECKGGLDLGLEAHFNQVNLIISRACNEPNRDYPRWDFKRICDTCWEMLTKGLIKCDNIVDPVVPFSESAKIYMTIEQNPGKSVKLGVVFD